MSSREQIDGCCDLELREVPIPEWGDGPFFLRGQTSGEDDAYSDQNMRLGVNKKGLDSVKIKSNSPLKVQQCLCDANAKQLYGPNEVPLLAKKSAKVINRLCKIIDEMNGTPQDDEEADDQVENFDGPQGDASGIN